MVQPIANYYSRHSGKSRNPVLFWIPGRVSLAWNDDPIPENVKLCESPAEPGVYLDANYSFLPVLAAFVYEIGQTC